MRVLVADDSAALRKVHRTILESMGHAPGEIIEAEDGNTVLALYRTPHFDVDLIIADGDLRGMDGLTLLKFLKTLSPPRSTPVVLCVNSSQRYLVTEAAKLGLRDYVERPFTDEEMRQKIGRIEAVIEVQKAQMATDMLRSIVSTAELDVDLPFMLQLPSAILSDFLATGSASKHQAGSVLLQSGDPVDALHLVTTGEIELSPEGSSRPPVVVGMGEPFGEVQFMAGGTSPVTVRAKTAVEVLSVDRVHVGEMVRRHPRLADYLSALAMRRSKAPARGSGHESEFFGSFRTMSFADVIQLMQVSQKNGVLSIEKGPRSGGLLLVSGEVKHAWAGELTGEEAFCELALWKDAGFSFSTERRDVEPTIHQPTITLLMEAMRRADEAGRQAAETRAAG